MNLCDHKGREYGVSLYPPVFGSTSLDWGLAEWHPAGASELSELSDLSDKAPKQSVL